MIGAEDVAGAVHQVEVALSRLGRRRGVGGGGVTGRDGLGRRIGLGHRRAFLGGFGSSVGLYWAQPAGQGARAAGRTATPGGAPGVRSDERRVRKGWVRSFGFRWSPYS